MDIDKLRDLIRMLENSTISEIEIEEDGRRIKLKKPTPEIMATREVVQALPHPAAADPAPAAPAAAPTPPAPVVEEEPEEHLVTIDSPMVGVYYSAPSPGDPVFVKPGDQVDTDQTLCIVEAMKLMNEVTAKGPAIITKCLVENGEPVEFGQPLFAIQPLQGA